MNYWLLKSEPFVYPWSQLVQERRGRWDGVRNYQAANNLRAMAVGDLGFFYHSNEGVEIVGVLKIAKTAYADPTDEKGKFVCVDVVPVAPMPKPVTLKAIKAVPQLAGMALLKQSRLSVSPVSKAEWQIICKMGGYKD